MSHSFIDLDAVRGIPTYTYLWLGEMITLVSGLTLHLQAARSAVVGLPRSDVVSRMHVKLLYRLSYRLSTGSVPAQSTGSVIALTAANLVHARLAQRRLRAFPHPCASRNQLGTLFTSL